MIPWWNTLSATSLNLSHLEPEQQATPSIALQQRQFTFWKKLGISGAYTTYNHRKFTTLTRALRLWSGWETHSWNSLSSLTLSPMIRIMMPSWVTIFCSCTVFNSTASGVRGGTSSEVTSLSSSCMTLDENRTLKIGPFPNWPSLANSTLWPESPFEENTHLHHFQSTDRATRTEGKYVLLHLAPVQTSGKSCVDGTLDKH